MTNKGKIATVILAAGESKRMGSAKQLLQWQGKALIQHIIDKSLQAGTHQTFVVLGANAETIQAVIQDDGLQLIMHDKWQSGLGSSISAAVNYIKEYSRNIDAILFCLTDQPLITPEHLQQLVKMFRATDKNIVATSYKNGHGVPAIFGKKYFEALATLSGDSGAKSIIKNNLDDSALLAFENAKIDLDTPDDLTALP